MLRMYKGQSIAHLEGVRNCFCRFQVNVTQSSCSWLDDKPVDPLKSRVRIVGGTSLGRSLKTPALCSPSLWSGHPAPAMVLCLTATAQTKASETASQGNRLLHICSLHMDFCYSSTDYKHRGFSKELRYEENWALRTALQTCRQWEERHWVLGQLSTSKR